MKNKNRMLIGFLLLLSIIAAVLFFTKRLGTIQQELKDFAIQDSASVDKIFLADKAGRSVKLTRTVNGWLVNDSFPARQEAINTILHTMLRLQVKNPVAKAARATVIKNMAAQGTKVEIYVRGELDKTYYVGGATQDQLGTFMLIENSSTPFVMFLPGMNGYLTTRYFTDAMQWKTRTIFKYAPEEIASVSVVYVDSADQSYSIDCSTRLLSQAGAIKHTMPTLYVDSLALRAYLMGFGNIQFELVVNGMKPEKRDSILKSQPLCFMNVVDKNGNKTNLVFYGMAVNERSLAIADERGAFKYDPDRMFAYLNGKDFLIVQHFVFDKLLRRLTDFTSVSKGSAKAS